MSTDPLARVRRQLRAQLRERVDARGLSTAPRTERRLIVREEALTLMRESGALLPRRDLARVVKAWLELGERQFPRFRAIRDVYELVYSAVFKDEASILSLDVRDLLAYRNYDLLPKGQGGRVAIPTREAQIMVWLVGGSGGVKPEPWLPLPDEIEAALEAARERVRDQQVGGRQAAQKRTAEAKAREATEQEQRDKTTKSPWRPRPTR